MDELTRAREKIEEAARIAVLTGAGISAPSGIPTFRDPGGLWENFKIEDYATPEGFARNPEEVWRWYAWRYRKIREAEPNEAHRLLAELERKKGDGFLLVTQNIDGLHQRAGSKRVIELHGSIHRARCTVCDYRAELPPPEDLAIPPKCPRCGALLRPDVVWFGELLPPGAFEAAVAAFRSADVALVVGTSAVVEPAASLGRLAKHAGAYLIEVNPEETPLTPLADLSLRAGAVEGLSALLR
ncbi:MAG TPA: NAD-dependent deacylase [Oceanithermus sp.]|nr:NAD-dependent deacylase [Oceanithermus sp.]